MTAGTASAGHPGEGLRSRADPLAAAPATLALAVLTLVTVGGMARLFQGASWAPTVLGAAAAAHLAGWGARRARWPTLAAAVLALLATFVVIAWGVLPGTTFYGVPAPGTVSTMLRDLSHARQSFSTVRAPAPALPGFVAAAAWGAALVAVLSDWAAFRLHATLEAVVPALATLIFVSVLATGAHPIGWTAGFVAALAIFVAVHESGDRSGDRVPFTGGSRRTRLGVGGVLLTAVIVACAVAVGPRLPGAHAAAVISVRHSSGNGPSRRTTISPLVDIRSRLVDESNTQLFTVSASQPAYWRLTSLDYFDGNIWSSDEPYSPVGSQIPVPPPPGAVHQLSQSFQITDLGSIWLPAAYLPTQVSGAPGVSWDPHSDSLISDNATSDGETYRITSVVPTFSPDELRRASLAPQVVSPVEMRADTELPGNVPAQVVDLARRITASAPTPYDKALALQNYLRDNYTYSLQVQAGHSDSALYDFLFVTHSGYCEQFAGAYAVMARAVGLPTRVAVGFTPGQQESDGLWHVLGMHAHAWPEVLLGQYGWVAFEPTPGRGIPGATSYTGVSPQQVNAPGTGTAPAPAAATPTTTPARPGPSRVSTRPTRPVPQPAAHRAGSSFSFLQALMALGAAALMWVAAVPAGRALRRRRRRSRAQGEAERVVVAWEEAAERLAAAGAPRRPGETLLEHARRAAPAVHLGPGAGRALEELAARASIASYAPAGHSAGAAVAAGARAHEVERAVLAGAGPWRRTGWVLDPRPPRSVSRT